MHVGERDVVRTSVHVLSFANGAILPIGPVFCVERAHKIHCCYLGIVGVWRQWM